MLLKNTIGWERVGTTHICCSQLLHWKNCSSDYLWLLCMEVFLLLTCFKGVWHTGGTKGTVLALVFQKAGRVAAYWNQERSKIWARIVVQLTLLKIALTCRMGWKPLSGQSTQEEVNATEPVLETGLVQFPAGSWAASTFFFLPRCSPIAIRMKFGGQRVYAESVSVTTDLFKSKSTPGLLLCWETAS